MLTLALVLAAGGTLAMTPTFDEAAWRSALETDRARTRAWYHSPGSYFAAVSRTDFGSATSLVVGRDPSAQVHVDDPALAPQHLRIMVQGDVFRLEAIAPDATFRVKDAEVREAVVGPSSVRVGRYTLRLSHQGFPAVIVFDPKSPALAHVVEPTWWAPAPAFRVVAKLARAEHPEEVVIQSTRGLKRRALKIGRFEFEIQGKKLALEANHLLEPGVDDAAVSVFFRDATTGKESYGVGRYIDPAPQPDGTWVLDFNAAYNPACAWSPHYNCPIPPKANTLPIAIEAGERTPPAH